MGNWFLFFLLYELGGNFCTSKQIVFFLFFSATYNIIIIIMLFKILLFLSQLYQ